MLPWLPSTILLTTASPTLSHFSPADSSCRDRFETPEKLIQMTHSVVGTVVRNP
jgi:hypothetical protein